MKMSRYVLLCSKSQKSFWHINHWSNVTYHKKLSEEVFKNSRITKWTCVVLSFLTSFFLILLQPTTVKTVGSFNWWSFCPGWFCPCCIFTNHFSLFLQGPSPPPSPSPPPLHLQLHNRFLLEQRKWRRWAQLLQAPPLCPPVKIAPSLLCFLRPTMTSIIRTTCRRSHCAAKPQPNARWFQLHGSFPFFIF